MPKTPKNQRCRACGQKVCCTSCGTVVLVASQDTQKTITRLQGRLTEAHEMCNENADGWSAEREEHALTIRDAAAKAQAAAQKIAALTRDLEAATRDNMVLRGQLVDARLTRDLAPTHDQWIRAYAQERNQKTVLAGQVLQQAQQYQSALDSVVAQHLRRTRFDPVFRAFYEAFVVATVPVDPLAVIRRFPGQPQLREHVAQLMFEFYGMEISADQLRLQLATPQRA